MFKSRWLFILAFGGLAHAQDAPVVLYNDAVLVCDETGCREWSKQELDNQDNDQGSSQETAHPQENAQIEYGHSAPRVAPGNIPPPPSNADTHRNESEDVNEDSNEPNWTDVSDLFAQWTMAVATLFIVAFTWLGLIVLRKTLSETKTAAKHTEATLGEAEQATIAAFETIATTREMGQAQSRAYLTISGALFKFIPESNHPAIKLTVLNSGHTPAKHVSIVFGVNYDPDGEPISHSKLRVRQLTDFGGGERREDIEIEMQWAPMPEGYFEKWMKGEEVPVFEGWFRFRDVFNERWKVPFQFEAFFEVFDGNWDYSPLDVPSWRFPLLSDGENQ